MRELRKPIIWRCFCAMLTFQHEKTAVHDLTISIFLPSESLVLRCNTLHFVDMVGHCLLFLHRVVDNTQTHKQKTYSGKSFKEEREKKKHCNRSYRNIVFMVNHRQFRSQQKFTCWLSQENEIQCNIEFLLNHSIVNGKSNEKANQKKKWFSKWKRKIAVILYLIQSMQ